MEDSSTKPGCLMAIASIFIRREAKKINKALDNDPEVIAATKKAHDSMVHLKGVVDEWTDKYGE